MHYIYSALNDSSISDDDYVHAQNVWSAFNFQSLGDYLKLYMKTDVLLLADIFENFREQCLNAYKLDPAHYYTISGLTWDAMLKYTKIRLELLTDVDKLMILQRGIRGGIIQCCNRYAKANNLYMDVYDENQDINYLVYFMIHIATYLFAPKTKPSGSIQEKLLTTLLPKRKYVLHY